MDKSLVQQLGKINDSSQVPEELSESYLSKLQFCGRKLDFDEENNDIKEKNDRLFYLQQMSDLFQESNAYPALVIPHFQQLFEMISINIFRPLPIRKKLTPTQESDLEAGDMFLQPSWSHLQPVYDIFLQVVVSDQMDVKILLKFITKGFIQQLLTLFDSQEPREREYVKNLCHRLYGKLVQKRKTFRKSIAYVFDTLVQEQSGFNGMAELLDILASIISGFAVPLKEEHVNFFRNTFIPLHKVQTSYLFHDQLQRCTMLFLSKMPELSHELIEALLKYWPFANSVKEQLFLSELIEVLEVCEMDRIKMFVEKLFKRVIKCISGPHLQIADRAMCFFENEYFLAILRQYKVISFPLIVPVIHRIADTHWHKVLQESLIALRSILRELDPIAYDRSLSTKNIPTLYLAKDVKKRAEDRQQIDEKWAQLQAQAKNQNPNFKNVQLAYSDKKVVGETNRLDNGNVVF